MGVTTTVDGNTSPITPSRFFKAVVDNDKFIPKLMPNVITRTEILQGDGGVGSIKQIVFAEGLNLKPNKYHTDELNQDTLTWGYTLIEGHELTEKLEKISYHMKFQAAPDGGSMYKLTTTYYIKDDAKLSEEEIKASKEGVLSLFKGVEGYLLQNSDAYA